MACTAPDGILLCSHHHRAHDDRCLYDRLPDGDVRFHRRSWAADVSFRRQRRPSGRVPRGPP